MRLYPLVALSLLFCTTSSLVRANSAIQFYAGNLSAVQQLAQSESKPVMIYFSASWCMPCQKMEETTYKHEALAAYVNENFLAVKLDIDDADGAEAFAEFGATMLPSIVLLNPAGRVPRLYESMQEPESLLSLLQQYHRDHHKPVASQQTVGTAPRANIIPKKRALVTDADPVLNNATLVAENTSSEQLEEKEDVVGVMAPRNGHSYTIICGRFNDYEQAVRKVRQMERRQRVAVDLEARNGYFVVLLGAYQDYKEAKQQLDELNQSSAIIGFREG